MTPVPFYAFEPPEDRAVYNPSWNIAVLITCGVRREHDFPRDGSVHGRPTVVAWDPQSTWSSTSRMNCSRGLNRDIWPPWRSASSWQAPTERSFRTSGSSGRGRERVTGGLAVAEIDTPTKTTHRHALQSLLTPNFQSFAIT